MTEGPMGAETDGATLRRAEHGLVEIPRTALATIPVTERGDRSTRWAGLQHGTLANTVLEKAEARGLQIRRDDWKVSIDGARLFGSLWIDHESTALKRAADAGIEAHGYDGFDPKIVGLRMGVLSSNDSTYALTLIVIARVLVCSNGMTVEGGHITARRKHTTNIGLELPGIVEAGIDTYVNRVGQIGETQSQLEALDFTRQGDVDHTIMEAGRRGIFPWSKVGRVEKEWRDIRHPEFRDRNGWSLMNCFSEVAKRFNPVREIQAVDRVRELVIETAPNQLETTGPSS
jgi:hypothetical protein